MNKRLKILMVSTEVNPFAKSGGLGDVCGSLPKELVKKGIDCRVVLPKYKSINKNLIENINFLTTVSINIGYRNDFASIYHLNNGVDTYFIENDYFFGRDSLYGYGDDHERFSFFCDSVLNLLSVIDFKPDIIHLNDWQTGLISVYLKDKYKKFIFYKDIKTLFTIHNLQYQGVFERSILSHIGLDDGYFSFDKLEYYGKVNFMKAGLIYSDMISTVSESYAKEIQTSNYGYGLDGVLRQRNDSLVGILNGIDTEINNPETDKLIYQNYNKNNIYEKYINKIRLQEELNLPVSDVPVFSIISRLAEQKGMGLIGSILEELLNKDIQIVILGTGEYHFENMFRHYAYRFPNKLSANIYFDNTLAQKIYAGSDMFLMPSIFEPCGLGQMFAMTYGSIPIARKTGGLSDTIIHYNDYNQNGNGFLFEDYVPSGLIWAINESLKYYYNSDIWRNIINNAMSVDFSWEKNAEKYINLYNNIVSN